MTGIICYKKIEAKIKEKLYKSVVRLAVLYGIKTILLTKVLEGKINTAEMRMLRFMKRVTRWDKIRNEKIQKVLELSNCQSNSVKKDCDDLTTYQE